MDSAANGGGISIPTGDVPMSNGPQLDHQTWSSADAASPSRTQGGEPPRRSSRSRSPGARQPERGYGFVLSVMLRVTNVSLFRREEQGNNPGNNLHVSGLSHRVDTRDLEQAFAKVGRVRDSVIHENCNAQADVVHRRDGYRSRKLRLCMTLTRVSRAVLGSSPWSPRKRQMLLLLRLMLLTSWARP